MKPSFPYFKNSKSSLIPKNSFFQTIPDAVIYMHARTHKHTHSYTHTHTVRIHSHCLSLSCFIYFSLSFLSLRHFSHGLHFVCICFSLFSCFFPSCLHNWSFLMTGCLIKEKFHQFPQLSSRISAQNTLHFFKFCNIGIKFTVNFEYILPKAFLIVTIETETTFHRDSSNDNS